MKIDDLAIFFCGIKNREGAISPEEFTVANTTPSGGGGSTPGGDDKSSSTSDSSSSLLFQNCLSIHPVVGALSIGNVKIDAKESEQANM